MAATRLRRHLRAPRAVVCAVLVDRRKVAGWLVPAGMTGEVHEFDARIGGRLRISLSDETPTGAGRASAHADTSHGRFVELVADTRLVEVVEFETADPALPGGMTITLALAAAAGGTTVDTIHDDLLRGLSAADNEAGSRSSLDRLAALLGAR